MSDTIGPVLTEETGKKIEEALVAQNSIMREARDLFIQQTAALKEMSAAFGGGGQPFYIPVNVVYDADNNTYSYTPKDDFIYSNMLKAYKAGRKIVMVMKYEGTIYFIPNSGAVVLPDGTIFSMGFHANADIPALSRGVFTLNSSGMISFSATAPNDSEANFSLKIGTAKLVERIKLVTSILLSNDTIAVLSDFE